MKKKFPTEVFVSWEEPEHDEPYLMADVAPEERGAIGDSRRVATYKLVEVRTLTFAPQWKKGRR